MTKTNIDCSINSISQTMIDSKQVSVILPIITGSLEALIKLRVKLVPSFILVAQNKTMQYMTSGTSKCLMLFRFTRTMVENTIIGNSPTMITM